LNHVIKQQGVSFISNSKEWILNSALFESSSRYGGCGFYNTVSNVIK